MAPKSSCLEALSVLANLDSYSVYPTSLTHTIRKGCFHMPLYILKFDSIVNTHLLKGCVLLMVKESSLLEVQ